jgi:hypothetical protein
VSLLNTVRPGPQTSNDQDNTSVGKNVRIFADEARVRLFEAGAMINAEVTTRPAVALGAALAAGVVVGWLVKRR